MKNLIGNKNTLAKLTDSARSGSLGHAYLFAGPENIGKTTLAEQLAKIILCSSSSQGECECQNCKLVNILQHPDLHIFDGYDANIEEIRELSQSLELKPYQSKSRVAIVSHIDRLSVQALNSFLKTLEEPNDNTVIILTAENKSNVLSTILSRVRTVDLCPATTKEVFEFLNLESGVKKYLANEISKISGGRVGLALYYNENPEKVEAAYKDSEEFYRRYISKNISDQIIFGDTLAAKKEQIEEKLNYYINFLYAKMNESRDYPKGIENIISLLDGIARAKILLRKNVNTKIVLESLMLGSLK